MTEKIEWTNAFETGLSEIDAQHRQLFGLLNNLIDLEDLEVSSIVLEKTVDDLVEYAATHFQTEERLFEMCGYPNANAHIAEHSAFVGKLVDIRDQLMAEDSKVAGDVIRFLSRWLVNHVKVSDRAYIATFKANGVG